eukprot:maker-scaffold521_size146803-snap-gene-0.10 protein:Tk12186 transcript:maker-scaffold521_size146803-snap-gene-0.10-mRNA-1 annotation:"proton-coupled amino acid transporter 4"
MRDSSVRSSHEHDLQSSGVPPSGSSVPRSHGARQRRASYRRISGSEMLDNLERFSRRTISVSSHSQDIHSEVMAALMEDGEEDEENSLVPVEDVHAMQDERDTEHAISNTETIIHILKGNIGIGVLTLPIAIRNSGLLFGNIGLACIAYMCVHCMKMLVNAAHKACAKRPEAVFLDYADTAKAAFLDAGGVWERWASFMGKLVNIFLCLSQVGSNAVYVLFIAQNIQPIVEHYGGELFHSMNYRIYIAAILPFMIAICMIKNLRYLSPFSVVANIFQFVGLGIIFYYIFREPLPHSASLPWVANVSRLPLFFGTAIFAIEGISVVLPIENQMKYPKEMLGWNGVLNTSMSMVGLLYVAMGFYGYLKYGEEIESSITLNLPPADILAQICLLLFSLSIFFSYALQFYVLMEILGPNVIRPRVSDRWYNLSEYGTRIVINIITFALAATVPWLDLVVSLLGAVKMSTLAIMAPALIDTASHWHGGRGFKNWRVVKNGIIFLIGFFGCIMGTYVSVLSIAQNFWNGQ